MTLPESHQNFCLCAHKCVELCVQPFKRLQDRIIPIPQSNAVPEAAPKSMYLFSCFHAVARDEMAKQQPSLPCPILQESRPCRHWDNTTKCGSITSGARPPHSETQQSIYNCQKLCYSNRWFSFLLAWALLAAPFTAVSKTTRALAGAQPLCRGSSAPTPCCGSIFFLLLCVLLQHFPSPLCLVDLSSWCIFWWT